jgi:hypothetical protein
VIRLIVLLSALAATIAHPACAMAADVPFTPGPIDHAFQRLYNFDFAGSLSILDAESRTAPQNPLVPAVRGIAYLFMELDRLKVLETRFFMNDDNMVDGATRPSPDPGVRARFYNALDEARKLADSRLRSSPEDDDALFALSMCAGLETEYVALVERRTWRSVKLAPTSLAPARKLLSRTPPVYDAYVAVGSLEYIVGDLPFFIRWLIHIDGIDGNKRRGIELVKLAATNGRYYGPFARILLVVASLRDKKFADAEQLLTGLNRDFPENPLFRKELTIVSDRARRARK